MAPRLGPASILDMVDPWDHDGNTLAVYREGGMDPENPGGPHALARGLCGRHAISYEWRPLVGIGCYSPFGLKGPRFHVRPGQTIEAESFTLYHEISERHLYACRSEPGIERACNQLAAHLRAPRAAFQLALGAVGIDLAELAGAFRASEFSSVLRVAETTGTPLALVDRSSGRVATRGDAWEWGDVVSLARRRIIPSGVLRLPVKDFRGRVTRTALLAMAA